jgi:hypothetical protein
MVGTVPRFSLASLLTHILVLLSPLSLATLPWYPLLFVVRL